MSGSEEPAKRIDVLQKVATEAAGRYELTIQGIPERTAELQPEPAIRFVMERCEGAFIYLWTIENQPVAVAQIYHRRFPRRSTPLWLHQFRSLINAPLELKRDARVFWRPSTADIDWRDVENVPAPSATGVGRRSQRKQIARKFKATVEMGAEGNKRKYQLQLKPRELFLYQSHKEESKTDGAIFWFARDDGNDPELLLFVEAVGKNKPDKWRYAVVDFTTFRMDVTLNGETIKTFPNIFNRTSFVDPNHNWSYEASE